MLILLKVKTKQTKNKKPNSVSRSPGHSMFTNGDSYCVEVLSHTTTTTTTTTAATATTTATTTTTTTTTTNNNNNK